MFESTILLTANDILTWAASASTLDHGTLVGGNTAPTGTVFDWTNVAQRDDQLALRDVALANAIANLAAAFATTWGAPVAYSAPPEPQGVTMPPESVTVSDPIGPVIHASPVLPPNSAYAADTGLQRRDVLLAAAINQLAVLLPEATVSSTALPSVPSLTVAWSLAEGAPLGLTINPILPLGVRAIKDPDRTSADRDNQLAINIAQLSQLLRNPFAVATRIVVQSESDPHEAESYVLVHEDSTNKIWQAEPGLPGRMRVAYNKASQTLAWADENAIAPLPYVQPYALLESSPPAAGPAQILTSPDGPKDAEFWRQKATEINCLDVKEEMSILMPNPGLYSIGDLQEDRGDAIFTRPGTILTTLTNSETLAVGNVRVAMLFTPIAEIVVDGAKGYVENSVVNGDYLGFPFTSGSSGETSGTLRWSLKLTPGPWSMAIYYTTLSGTATEWPFLITLGDSVISNLGITFPAVGTVISSNYFLTSQGGTETLEMTLPAGSGNQVQINKIVFTRTANSENYTLTAILGSVSSGALVDAVPAQSIEVQSYPYRTDTLSFTFEVAAELTNPGIQLVWTTSDDVTKVTPLRIESIEVMSYSYPSRTHNSVGFEGWSGEMAERAARAVTASFFKAFSQVIGANPDFVLINLDLGEVVGTTRYWTPVTTARWIDLLKVVETRFGSAFRTGGPGDVGRPALVPFGLQFDVENSVNSRAVTLNAEVVNDLYLARVVATQPDVNCYPVLAAYQPWMATIGLPVMVEDFWVEANTSLKLFTITVDVDRVNGAGVIGGSVSGGGNFPYSDPITVSATTTTIGTFVGWYEGATRVSTSEDYSFQVTRSRTLLARFTVIDIIVSASPSGGGVVTGGGYYVGGTTVAVTAAPNANYEFSGWYVGANEVSSDASYSFTASVSESLVAHFTPTVDVSVIAEPSLGGTFTGAGPYPPETSATMTATANAGYSFSGWYSSDGVLLSLSSSYTFTVHVATSLVATFSAIIYSMIMKVLVGSDGASTDPDDQAVTLPYSSSSVTVRLRVRTIDENKTYSGATMVPITSAVQTVPSNGDPIFTDRAARVTAASAGGGLLTTYDGKVVVDATDTSNEYLLIVGTVSSPSRVYALNYCPIHRVWFNTIAAQDYEFEMTVPGDSVLTLIGRTMDSSSFPNTNNVTVPVNPGDPPLNVDQPFAGQFVQVDIMSVVVVAPVTVSLSASPLFGGTVSGGGSYPPGVSATVTATPNSGYGFDGWYDNTGTKVVASFSYTFIAVDKLLMAKFYAIITTLYLEIPINNADSSCVDPTDRSVTLDSAVPPPNAVVMVRIRGVMELNEYPGATITYMATAVQTLPTWPWPSPFGGAAQAVLVTSPLVTIYGGAGTETLVAAPSSGYNEYLLIVGPTTAPTAVYALNYYYLSGPCIGNDYQFRVVIPSGSLLTLICRTIDDRGYPNMPPYTVVPVGSTDPPIIVSQPFDGQFVQVDVTYSMAESFRSFTASGLLVETVVSIVGAGSISSFAAAGALTNAPP